VEVIYPGVTFDLGRDIFVVWLRWVSRESPPSPTQPASQGIRVELKLNRNCVLGPTIVYRRDLERPVYLRANRARTVEVMEGARGGVMDLQLIIHGSVANAPFAAVYLLRDYTGEAIETDAIPATPLLQIQPSTPGDQWHVAGQANIRLQVELEGSSPHRLRVIK